MEQLKALQAWSGQRLSALLGGGAGIFLVVIVIYGLAARDDWFVGFTIRAALLSGVALGALYGIMAVALVLTFQMSRIIGFVHGGIALASAFLYWWLTADPARTSGASTGGFAYETQEWNKPAATILAVLLGALLGLLFGGVVTGRMASWPKVTVTTFALGGMLLFTGIADRFWEGAFEIVPSPFGQGRFENIFNSGYNLSHHQVAVILFLLVLVTALHLVVTYTQLGVQIRAVADDVEAAEMVGVPVHRITLGMWCFTGALAGLSGVLLTPMTRLAGTIVLFVLIRSMAGAVLGGFTSLPLALLGSMIFGQVESHVEGGTFGRMSSGWREIILMAVLAIGVIMVSRAKLSRFRLAEV